MTKELSVVRVNHSQPLHNLQMAVNEPNRWWKLKLDGTTIKVASFLQKNWQWVVSFFSNCHKNALRKRLICDAEMVQKDDSSSEKGKIVYEKFLRLCSKRSGAWVEGIPIHIALPPILRTHKKSTDPSLIRPHFADGRYYNYKGERIWAQLFETLWLLFPGCCKKPTKQDLRTWNRVGWQPHARSIEPRFTWLGHASLLIQMANMNFLFDPTFNFVTPWLRRHAKAGISLEDLPPIDVLSISHIHRDHLEESTTKKLQPYQPVVFVPEGVGATFRKQGFSSIEEHNWWSETTFTREGRQVKLTAIPAKHNSGTNLHDINCTLWMGVMIEGEGHRFYFAGDTGFDHKMFSDIKKQFGKIDVAFLPIAPENEHNVHLDLEDSLRAFQDLGAQWMVPIHWGAYRTGREKIEEPILELQRLLQTSRFSHLKDRVLMPRIGELFFLERKISQNIAS